MKSELELQILRRIKEHEANGSRKSKFSDFATEEDRAIFEQVKNWDISDEELFED